MSENRNLSRYFDKSAAVVQDACTQFEKNYARPAYQNMRGYFEERPILSTFVTIFTLLSLVPIAFFAGTCLFVFVTFTLTALLTALFASLTIVLFCFGFLAVVLFGILLASLFLTGATIASYSLIRLALHVQREGASTGVSEWGRETRDSLLTKQSKPQNGLALPPTVKKEETEREELSNGYVKSQNGPTHSERERVKKDGGVEVRKPKEVLEKRAFPADDEYNERLIDETLSDQEDLHHHYFEHRQQQHRLPPPLSHQPHQPQVLDSPSSSPHYIPISATNTTATTRTTPPKSKLRPQQQQQQQLHQPQPFVRDYATNLQYGDYNVDVQGHQ